MSDLKWFEKPPTFKQLKAIDNMCSRYGFGWVEPKTAGEASAMISTFTKILKRRGEGATTETEEQVAASPHYDDPTHNATEYTDDELLVAGLEPEPEVTVKTRPRARKPAAAKA
jgi:hypothetical protein